MLGLGLGLTKSQNKTGGVLESYKSSIAMGFSYYKLFASSKKCVRVRRSSDNAIQDFGFTGNYVDINAILAFCGVGSGFVHTWYNQFLGGNDAIQVVNSNQSQIVSSGVFENDGIRFVSATSTYLKVEDYNEIDIINPYLGIYTNSESVNQTGYVFSKLENSSSTAQFYQLNFGADINSVIRNVSIPFGIPTNTPIKTLMYWNDLLSGGYKLDCEYLGNIYKFTSTVNSNLINYTKFTIGARHSTGDIYTSFFNSNIKTIIIAKNEIPFSKLKGV